MQYGLNPDTGEVDFDEVARLAETHRPRLIIGGFSAYSRRLDWQVFRDIADSVGAYLLVRWSSLRSYARPYVVGWESSLLFTVVGWTFS